MLTPSDLYYSKDHEWIKIDQGYLILGITDYAQSELGDIVFVELPLVNTIVNAKDTIGTIEAIKTVADIYSPVKGEIVEVNENINNLPELINSDPYGKGWLIKLKTEDTKQVETMLTNKQYLDLIK